MQESAEFQKNESSHCRNRESQKYSPDITCVTFQCPPKPPKTEEIKETESEAITDNPNVKVESNCSHAYSMNMNPIPDVPPGYYEYIYGGGGELRILCKVCQYVSNKKSNFKRHFTNMHFVHEEENKVLECCGMRFSTKGEKFYHTKSVHKSGYKCTICFKVFDRPALLQRHLAKHTGKKPYKCSLCSYQTPNKANAKRHIEKRHSDVSEGSILFVTDDGEQILIEVVSKSDKESTSGKERSSPGSSSSASIPISTRGYKPYSPYGDMSPVTRHKMPHMPSATVTSENATNSPGFFTGPMYDLGGNTEERKRHLSHSIDTILNPSMHQGFFNKGTTFPAGLNLSVKGNESNPPRPTVATSTPPSVIPVIGSNHHNINELPMSHYPFNWSQSSTPFPFNYYRKPQPCFFQPSPFAPGATPSSSAPALLQSHCRGSSFLVHQCEHGCWHHELDNQATSDFPFSRNFAIFKNSSPDLRSSSSFSQFTENTSYNSVRTEDEEEEDDDSDDMVDVVGDDEDATDASTSKKLKHICEGLGSFTTTEASKLEAMKGEVENNINANISPPTDTKRAFHRGNDAGVEMLEDESFSADAQYIPKKLRVSKAYFKYVQKSALNVKEET